MKAAVRSVKNVTKGYSDAQIKVRKATSNEAWGPSGTDMAEISQMTFDNHDFLDVMDMIDRRLNDRGKMWRHVYKALQVLDYCVHSGSENVVRWCKDNIFILKTLREFQYIDDDGVDQGNNVRIKAKDLSALIMDDERLRQARANRSNMNSRMTRHNNSIGLDEPYSPRYDRLPRRRNTRTGGEDDDDEMRRAIEASKRQAEEDALRRGTGSMVDNDSELAKALKLSKEEEDLRQSRIDAQNQNSLFDDSWDLPAPQQQQQQQPYQQQQQVDFWGNLVDPDALALQQQQQSTGYLNNLYNPPSGIQQPNQTGFQQVGNTGFQPNFTQAGFNAHSPSGFSQFPLETGGFQQSPSSSQSNNPYSTLSLPQQSLEPMPTGSNNPFAQFSQQPSRAGFSPSLSSLSEQPQSTTFGQVMNNNALAPQSTSFSTFQSTSQQKPIIASNNAHESSKLSQLIAAGNPTGQDTFGNTGDLRIPAHHGNRPGFINSAGQGLRPSLTGTPNNYVPGQSGVNNPFHSQNITTGPRPLTQSATGPAQQGNFGQSGWSQPQQAGFGTFEQQGGFGQHSGFRQPNAYGQQNQTGSLIDF